MRPLWMLKDADISLQAPGSPETVLRRLNLRIDEGEFVAVVGRNGSGKSTLLRALGGFAQVTHGEIAADPETMRSARTVFQNPDAQIIGETVFEDVSFGLENLAVPSGEMPGRVTEALASVGLRVRGDERVEHLSGGQKQLLCMAGAVVTGTRILLLDEPAAMLDPSSKSAVLSVAKRLHENGTTVVWATQAMDEIGYAERVIALKDGEVAFDGTPERFLYGDGESGSSCPCSALGFRLPYAVAAAHRLLAAGLPLRGRPVRGEQLLKVVSEACQ
ncbi:ATP-binding cassette domain-containing protein [Paenibacillus mesophilus]|uniref:energy-coupling factor ABC transporter ATP-binding protein n=1 Tax=Paenibacillus mesophilus TaxID=2582849 RepID=UPI00110D6097|nr:ATP-binding cassette domain-containing protein [Paenibacillus mesophilus]TMV46855.1 ATP-binding cassette domain-containing protein [Paenibacillus mesophilus]